MSNKTEITIGPGVLFLIFLVLRLTHEIDWSWWWVTSPLWIPLAVGIGAAGIGLVVVGVVFLAMLVFDR